MLDRSINLASALVTIGLAASAIAATFAPASAQIVAQKPLPEVKIYCGQALDPSSKSSLPATLASVTGQGEPKTLIIWKSEAFQQFSPQRRCETVSPKFQEAYQSRRYNLIAAKNSKTGIGIICAVANPEENCDPTKMLFTLKSYQSASNTIEQLAYTLSGRVNSPIYESSNSGKSVANLRDLLGSK